MAYHQHVIEVLEYLKVAKDDRYKTMFNLTLDKSRYLEEMWECIFAEESKRYNVTDSKWVLDFIDDVFEYSRDVSYFYLSNAERDKLLRDIRKYTEKLVRIYKGNGFDPKLISNDGQFFAGFHQYDKNHNVILENGKRPKVSISVVLQHFESEFSDVLSETAEAGYRGDLQKSNRFIRCMSDRNKFRYGVSLENVLMITTDAIYAKEYDLEYINDLIKRKESSREKRSRCNLEE